MKRWIYTYRTVNGDSQWLEAALLKHADELLRAATGAPYLEPDGDGSFLIALEADPAGIHIAKRVRASLGVARHDTWSCTALPLTWQADPAQALFPRFSGTLEWQPLSTAHGQLTLVGSYETPLGWIGGAVDATLLRNVAHRTADKLVDDLARQLGGLAEEPVIERLAGPKQGALRVADVMTSDPILLDESLPLRTAALILFHAEISGAAVVAADGGLIGVLSEADVLPKEADERFGFGSAAAAQDQRRRARTVAEACSSPAHVTAPDTRLAAAAREMLDKDVSRLIVVAEGRIVGIVSRHDVLAALVRDDRQLLDDIRRQLDTAGLSSLNVDVEWGHVTLSGTTQLHSTAGVTPRIVEKIDGVMSVDDSALDWVEDDVFPRIPAPL